jgi:NADH dehydrogenase
MFEMQGLVTIFGGSGFIGAQTVRALAKQGYRIRVAVRQPGRGYRLRMLGDVGQIEVVQANLRNQDSVKRALAGAQACINLVGILRESGRQGFMSLHEMGARTVAQAAKAAGATTFVQMSALGADANGESKYARTKAAGEAAVREVFPKAIIIRPSVVFGPEDHLFNKFAQLASLAPILPLPGAATKMQPVFVGDVAAAIAKAVAEPSLAGATLELGGPRVMTLREIVELVLREIGRNPPIIALPWNLAGLMGAAGDIAGALINPPITSDQVLMLKSDNVAGLHGQPGLASLGIVPTPVEAVVPGYLYRYRKGGQYAEAPAGAV